MLYKAKKNSLVVIVARAVPWRKYGLNEAPTDGEPKRAAGIFSGGWKWRKLKILRHDCDRNRAELIRQEPRQLLASSISPLVKLILVTQ